MFEHPRHDHIHIGLSGLLEFKFTTKKNHKTMKKQNNSLRSVGHQNALIQWITLSMSNVINRVLQ
jgi:hypothetical protein